MLALTLACDGGFAWARYQLSHNETLLDRTLARATALTSNAVAASEQVGVPRSVSARILEEAEDLFRGLAGLGQQTPQLRFRKASMLIEFARMHATLGNAELLQARAAEADRLMQRLAADVPGNLVWRQGFAVNYDRLGAALQAQGRFKEARASYQVSLAIAERLASDPGNLDRQHELAVRYLKVGDVDLDQGALGEAHAKYHSSLVIAEHLAAVDSGNARWQHDLLLAHERIADVARLQGERDAALAGYRESRALAERLVAGDPGNAEWQRALSVSHVKFGDVLTIQGKPDEALASYRAAHAVAGRLAAAVRATTAGRLTSATAMNGWIRAGGPRRGRCRAWRSIGPAWLSPAGSPPPTPAMPAGSGTSALPMSTSATSCGPAAILPER